MSVIDTVYTYKFINLLTTPWKEQDAFKLGIIDDKGTVLRKPKTQDEKDAYTSFHRLAWNIKRIVQKMPGGSSKFSNYASALFLIKEQGNTEGVTSMKLNIIQEALAKKLDEEPTNVIGDAGKNDNIKTYDPKLKLRGKKDDILRRKKKDEGAGSEYEDLKRKDPALTNEGDEPSTVDYIKEAMKRRKKRDAHGKVQKFYKRTSDCPPGHVKNREGGCDKIGGTQSLQQIKKTRKITQKKRKKTLKKKGKSFWRMADMRRKKTERA